MPHGHCFLWQPGILWLQVISDAVIVAAYYSIPLLLIYFARKRTDLPFKKVFWLFGAFILLCGTTHLMEIWIIWNPDYAIHGAIKALTAIVSLATFFVTARLMPKALKLPRPAQLEALNAKLNKSIQEKDEAQYALRKSYEWMEKKVKERTAELMHKNEALYNEIVERKRAEEKLSQALEKLAHSNGDMLLHNQAASGGRK